MQRALNLAQQAIGTSRPNPPVGAVILKNGEIIGEGWTQSPGQPHAEIIALRKAGNEASGAILYVTLEPCNHSGRTPPCTTAIIESKISQVFVCTLDPNPQMNGLGINTLRDAGIDVYVGSWAHKASDLIEAHTKYIISGRPLVTVKFASSIDGKIATTGGDSKWISTEQSRSYVHSLRGASDAIMVGINTVLTDNPRLTVRKSGKISLKPQPLRIVVDSSGRLPHNSRLLSQPGETLVAVAEPAVKIPNAEVIVLPDSSGNVDLENLIIELGRREITSVFVEGGGELIGALFDLKLVDKVVAFVAPIIIGGKTAPTPVGGVGINHMSKAVRLNKVKIENIGDDVMITGYCNL